MKTKTTETKETSIQEQRSSGHGNYGIVNEPCKLHMPEAIIKNLMGDGSSYAYCTAEDVRKFDKAFNNFFAKRGLIKQRRFVL